MVRTEEITMSMIDYLDKDLEKEVDSWMIDFVGFIDSDFGYEPKINVKVWTK